MDVHPPVKYQYVNIYMYIYIKLVVQLAKMLIALVGKLAGLDGFDFKDIGK